METPVYSNLPRSVLAIQPCYGHLQKHETEQKTKNENILLTCEECKDFAHSCLHREINTFRHLYRDPTEVGTRNGHLSAFHKEMVSAFSRLKIEDKIQALN